VRLLYAAPSEYSFCMPHQVTWCVSWWRLTIRSLEETARLWGAWWWLACAMGRARVSGKSPELWSYAVCNEEMCKVNGRECESLA
jgi:hypothetical protein